MSATEDELHKEPDQCSNGVTLHFRMDRSEARAIRDFASKSKRTVSGTISMALRKLIIEKSKGE